MRIECSFLIGESVSPGDGDWTVTPIALCVRSGGRQGSVRGQVWQRWDSARPDIRVFARDDLQLPRSERRGLLIAACRAYGGLPDHYCADESQVMIDDLAVWLDEYFVYKRSARLLTCIEKRLLQYGQPVQSN